MLQSKSVAVDKKTKPILISKNLKYAESLGMNFENGNNYGLKQNLFDPSKSSPPNEFMLKLNMRMNMYNQ